MSLSRFAAEATLLGVSSDVALETERASMAQHDPSAWTMSEESSSRCVIDVFMVMVSCDVNSMSGLTEVGVGGNEKSTSSFAFKLSTLSALSTALESAATAAVDSGVSSLADAAARSVVVSCLTSLESSTSSVEGGWSSAEDGSWAEEGALVAADSS